MESKEHKKKELEKKILKMYDVQRSWNKRSLPIINILIRFVYIHYPACPPHRNKMPSHWVIFISAIHLKMSNLEKTLIFSPILHSILHLLFFVCFSCENVIIWPTSLSLSLSLPLSPSLSVCSLSLSLYIYIYIYIRRKLWSCLYVGVP